MVEAIIVLGFLGTVAILAWLYLQVRWLLKCEVCHEWFCTKSECWK
jgi:hypothetical protein